MIEGIKGANRFLSHLLQAVRFIILLSKMSTCLSVDFNEISKSIDNQPRTNKGRN